MKTNTSQFLIPMPASVKTGAETRPATCPNTSRREHFSCYTCSIHSTMSLIWSLTKWILAYTPLWKSNNKTWQQAENRGQLVSISMILKQWQTIWYKCHTHYTSTRSGDPITITIFQQLSCPLISWIWHFYHSSCTYNAVFSVHLELCTSR